MKNQEPNLKFKSCVCNNSLKYMIIKTISLSETPFYKDDLLKRIILIIESQIVYDSDQIDSNYIYSLAERLLNELIAGMEMY